MGSSTLAERLKAFSARRFYALNHRFAAADLKKRMKWKLHEIKNLPIRALRKVKAVFTAKKKQGEQ